METYDVLKNWKDRPLDVVVDVGAGFGGFAIRAVEYGAKTVYAFEPDPDKFKRLAYHTVEFGHWGTVVPLPYAVSRETEPNAVMWGGATNVRTMGLWRFLTSFPQRVDLLRLNMRGDEWLTFCMHPQAIFYALAKVDYIVIEANLLSCDRVASDEWVPKGSPADWVPDMLTKQGFACEGHESGRPFRRTYLFERVYDHSGYLKSHGVSATMNDEARVPAEAQS